MVDFEIFFWIYFGSYTGLALLYSWYALTGKRELAIRELEKILKKINPDTDEQTAKKLYRGAELFTVLCPIFNTISLIVEIVILFKTKRRKPECN